MTNPAPKCMNCQFYHFNNYIINSCEAYPGGIPRPIIDSEEMHDKPNGNDNGFFYKPIK